MSKERNPKVLASGEVPHKIKSVLYHELLQGHLAITGLRHFKNTWLAQRERFSKSTDRNGRVVYHAVEQVKAERFNGDVDVVNLRAWSGDLNNSELRGHRARIKPSKK